MSQRPIDIQDSVFGKVFEEIFSGGFAEMSEEELLERQFTFFREEVLEPEYHINADLMRPEDLETATQFSLFLFNTHQDRLIKDHVEAQINIRASWESYKGDWNA